MANRDGAGDDGEEVCWNYAEILAEGSDELQAIIEIITGGCPPGIPIKEKERKKDAN